MFVVVLHPASNNQLELIGWLLAAGVGAMSLWANRSASRGLRVRAAERTTESEVGGCCHHAMS